MDSWTNDLCERGHDMTDPANVGVRQDKGHRRYCKGCVNARRVEMWETPLPWGDALVCERGHDVSYRMKIGHRSVGGAWVAFCRECDDQDREGPRPTRKGRLSFQFPAPGSDKWKSEGNCFDFHGDPDLFFDKKGSKEVAYLCEDCPVRAACEEYADKYKCLGLWGGQFRQLTKSGTYRRYPV